MWKLFIIAFNKEDFPDPVGPNIAINSPFLTNNEISFIKIRSLLL